MTEETKNISLEEAVDENKLNDAEVQNIAGGGPSQWNEVKGYIRKYIQTHCPETVRDPQNIHDGEIARFMHFNLPDYEMAAMGRTEKRQNNYFFTSGKILGHDEFMAYLRTTLSM